MKQLKHGKNLKELPSWITRWAPTIAASQIKKLATIRTSYEYNDMHELARGFSQGSSLRIAIELIFPTIWGH
jgi:hypothetical protein